MTTTKKQYIMLASFPICAFVLYQLFIGLRRELLAREAVEYLDSRYV